MSNQECSNAVDLSISTDEEEGSSSEPDTDVDASDRERNLEQAIVASTSAALWKGKIFEISDSSDEEEEAESELEAKQQLRRDIKGKSRATSNIQFPVNCEDTFSDVEQIYPARITSHSSSSSSSVLEPPLKRRRVNSTSSCAVDHYDSDARLAAQLAEEEEELENSRREQEEADELYARTIGRAEEIAARKAKAARERGEEKTIAFQVTMDAEGKTIEGNEDGDNLAQSVLVTCLTASSTK